MAETRDTLFDKIIPWLPIAGLIFAVSYDVGYFWGSGIHFFTLFSLSEHVVFALQALPFALAMTFGTVLVLALVWSTAGRFDGGSVREERGTNATRFRGLLRLLKRHAGLLIVFGTAIVQFTAGNIRLGIATLAAMISMIVVELLAYDRQSFLRMLAPAGILMGAIMSLLFGHYSVTAYLTNQEPNQSVRTKTGGVEIGLVVRSGERGVMYFNTESKNLVFRPWQDIESVSGKVDPGGVPLWPYKKF